MNKEQKIDEFIKVLGGRKNGTGAMCCCPAHDDKNPSLAVDLSEEGKLLVHCHAKCPPEIVIFKLIEKGLWNREIPKPRTILSENEWIYDDENLQPTLKVKRYVDHNGKKQYPLSNFQNGIWIPGKSEKTIIPYRYKEWDLTYNKYIFIVEGEKCADVLYLKHLNATTAPLGAGKWPPRFGQYFKGFHVAILPDNDEPGKKHAQMVLKNIEPYARSIRLVELPKLGLAEDVVDYFQKTNSSVEDFLKLVEATEPIAGNQSNDGDDHLNPQIWAAPIPYKEENDSLPIVEKKDIRELLPGLLYSWFDDISTRLNVPLEAVSTIGLSVIAGAIGTRIYFKPKERDNWKIYPCSVWCLIVSLPGGKKTPTLLELYMPLKKVDELFEEEYQQKVKENEPSLQILKIQKDAVLKNIKELQKDNNQSEIAKCKEQLASILAEESTLKVPRRRITTSGTTVSKLIEILVDNPEGIIFNKDELKGLLDSFYANGNERLRPILLEGWAGTGQFTDDTISNGTRRVKSCAITVIGAIQPAVLSNFISKSDDGFIERFGSAITLLQQPFVDDLDTVFNESVYREIERMFIEISNISIDDEYSCRMTENAKVLFNGFRKDFYNLKISPAANSKIVTHISKYETLFGGLCIVWSLAKAYERNKSVPSALNVDESTASQVIKWITTILYPHAKYIYDNTIIKHSVKVLVEKILNGKVKDGDTIRSIAHNEWSGLRNSDSVLTACEQLEKINWLKVEERKSAKGGRTSTAIRINPHLKTEGSNGKKSI